MLTYYVVPAKGVAEHVVERVCMNCDKWTTSRCPKSKLINNGKWGPSGVSPTCQAFVLDKEEAEENRIAAKDW